MIARRLRRFSFGPDSSTKTMRVSKKPPIAGDLGVDRVRDDVADAAAEVGSVKYCCPAICWPASTSQSRNSALSRPEVARDAAGHQRLRAAAFQASKRGAASKGGPLGKALLVDRHEIARALQVVGDDRRDASAEIALAGEIGDGDRHRLERAAGADPRVELRRRGQRAGEQRGDEASAPTTARLRSANRMRSSRGGIDRSAVDGQLSTSKLTYDIFHSCNKGRIARGCEGRAAAHGAERGLGGGAVEAGPAALTMCGSVASEPSGFRYIADRRHDVSRCRADRSR